MNTDLRLLRSLIAVVDCGTVVGAARARGYSTSAVSRQLGVLQRRLGLQLFLRHGRCITPTPAAIALTERARELVDTADQFERYLTNLADVALRAETPVGVE